MHSAERASSASNLWRPVSEAILLTSALQGAFFAENIAASRIAIFAIAVAVANAAAVIGYLRTGRTRIVWASLILVAVQIAIFVENVERLAPPPERLLQVAIVASYFATLLTGLFLSIPVLRNPAGIALAFLLPALVWVAEAEVTFLAPRSDGLRAPSHLVTSMSSDPRLGGVHRPNSGVRVYYSGTPQNAFEDLDVREDRWNLRVAGGNAARLIFPAGHPDRIRVEILKSVSPEGFDTQLNEPGFHVKGGDSYQFSFRARADRPRTIVAAFAMAHDPWKNLGCYREESFTPQWREVTETFIATGNDDNARLHFDGGKSDVAFEVESVHLLHLPDGATLEPQIANNHTYSIDYRFNSLGCRGPDYAVPKPASSTRIAVLGNSYVLGEGVEEDATVSQRLQELLNAPGGSAAYEVINCGAAGYGTREERLFYENPVARYEPNIVILGMTAVDDPSFWSLEKSGYFAYEPGKLSMLFATWANLEEFLHRPPSPDFAKCVEEVRQLDHDVRQHNGQLVVFLFRNNADYSGSTSSGKLWNRLSEVVTLGLQGTGIPVLDLGPALQKTSSDLQIHDAIGFEPNEEAHAFAATELARFLREKSIVK